MKKHVVNDGRALGGLDRFPPAILTRIPSGLFVDVGAAIGAKTRQMLRASPQSHVIAFEPFAGNLAHLRPLEEADPRISVRPVALADYNGTGQFCVKQTISTKKDRRWTSWEGASMVGHLSKRKSNAEGIVQTVPVRRLDEEIATPIRFLKADIQGGEYAFLRGAEGLIRNNGVDFLYVEFRGDPRVLRLLDEYGYFIVDCVYMMWPHWLARRLFRSKARWTPASTVVRRVDLHTGARAVDGWLRVPFRSPVLYCAWFWFMRLFVCGLQTDLFCVHRSQEEAFARIWPPSPTDGETAKATHA